MSLLASRFVGESFPNIAEAYVRELRWTETDGLRYCSLNDCSVLKSPLMMPLLRRWGEEILSGYDFELIEVFGLVKPHHHKKSDGIVINNRSSAAQHGYFESGEKSGWEILEPNQIIILPRGTNHGFQFADHRRKFYLLSIFSPGIEDDDVYYVE